MQYKRWFKIVVTSYSGPYDIIITVVAKNQSDIYDETFLQKVLLYVIKIMPYRGCHLLVFCRMFGLKKYVNHIGKRLEPIVLGWSFLGSFLSFRLVCNFIKKEALGYAVFFEFCEHSETFFCYRTSHCINPKFSHEQIN